MGHLAGGVVEFSAGILQVKSAKAPVEIPRKIG